jgi:hypothetical protein
MSGRAFSVRGTNTVRSSSRRIQFIFALTANFNGPAPAISSCRGCLEFILGGHVTFFPSLALGTEQRFAVLEGASLASLATASSPLGVSHTLPALGAGQQILTLAIRRLSGRGRLILVGVTLSDTLAYTILVETKSANFVLVSSTFGVGFAHSVRSCGRNCSLEAVEAGLPCSTLGFVGSDHRLEKALGAVETFVVSPFLTLGARLDSKTFTIRSLGCGNTFVLMISTFSEGSALSVRRCSWGRTLKVGTAASSMRAAITVGSCGGTLGLVFSLATVRYNLADRV